MLLLVLLLPIIDFSQIWDICCIPRHTADPRLRLAKPRSPRPRGSFKFQEAERAENTQFRHQRASKCSLSGQEEFINRSIGVLNCSKCVFWVFDTSCSSWLPMHAAGSILHCLGKSRAQNCWKAIRALIVCLKRNPSWDIVCVLQFLVLLWDVQSLISLNSYNFDEGSRSCSGAVIISLADAKCLGMGCTLQFDQIWMPELYIYIKKCELSRAGWGVNWWWFKSTHFLAAGNGQGEGSLSWSFPWWTHRMRSLSSRGATTISPDGQPQAAEKTTHRNSDPTGWYGSISWVHIGCK